jgi:hypothetical protein
MEVNIGVRLAGVVAGFLAAVIIFLLVMLIWFRSRHGSGDAVKYDGDKKAATRSLITLHKVSVPSRSWEEEVLGLCIEGSLRMDGWWL